MRCRSLGQINDLLLAVYCESDPSDSELSDAMVTFKKADPSRARLLVLTLGGRPHNAERRQLNTFLNGRTMLTAIVYEGSRRSAITASCSRRARNTYCAPDAQGTTYVCQAIKQGYACRNNAPQQGGIVHSQAAAPVAGSSLQVQV